ncbi:transglutaminase-like domain-containing protein [Agathobacter sp.]
MHKGIWEKQKSSSEGEHITNAIACELVNSIAAVLLVMCAVNIVKSTLTDIVCPYYVYLLVFLWGITGGIVNRIPWPDGKKWVRHAINLGFLLLFAIILFRAGWGSAERIRDGFYYVQGQFVKRVNKYYGISLFAFDGKKQFVSVFMGFAVSFIAIVMQTLASEIKRKRIYTLFPTVMLAAQLCIGASPKVTDMVMYVICVIWCIIADQNDDRKIWRSMLYMAGIGAVMGVCVFAFEPLANTLADQKPKMLAYQKNLESDIKSLFISKRDIQDGTVTNNYPNYRDKVVMTVESDCEPEGNMYLRSYYGDRYENGKWNRTADFSSLKNDYSNASELVAKENEIGIASCYWGEYSSERSPALVEYTITTKDMKTDYAYVPYGINPSKLKTDSGVDISEDYVIKKSKNDDEVTVSAASQSFFNGDTENTTLIPDQCAVENSVFYEEYNNFVRDHYIGAPKQDGIVELDGRLLLKNAGLSRDMLYKDEYVGNVNGNRILAAQFVQEFLTSKSFKYSKNPPSADGEDIVENFLANSKEGFCVHFASAGTMLLRQMGCPARYVSGYVVKESSFKQVKNRVYTSEVKDSQSHAWVEIYLDDFGWIPVEMTPGYFTSSYNAFDAVSLDELYSDNANQSVDDSRQDSQVTDSESESQTDSQEESVSDNVTDTEGVKNTEQGAKDNRGKGQDKNASGLSVVWKLAAAVVVTVVLIAVIVYARLRRQSLWEARLKLHAKRGRYSKAAIMINNLIYRDLGRFSRKNTDSQYLEALKKAYSETDYGRIDWDEYMRIIQKAVYSRDGIDREEYLMVLEIWKIYTKIYV